MLETQVVSRDRSLVIGAASTVRFGSVNATDASAMLLMFCSSEFDPRPYDTSVVYLCDHAVPVWASVDTVLPIVGTADILAGPENPLEFGSYRFSYASADSQTNWHPIGVTHPEPAYDDTMETWDTHGLTPGTYILKMTMKNSYGDSIEPTKGVNLGYAGVGGGRQPAANSSQSLPTVVRRVLYLPGSSLSLHPSSLFDLSGSRVLDLRPGANDVSHLAPGVYLMRAASRERSATTCRKLILTR
jgi:hypothetical protein